MPSAASTTPVPACPRCGYDQSGEIARWATPHQGEAAPATPPAPPTPTGRCTECGLEFLWADVLEPERRQLPGFFEHSRGLAAFFVSAWQTWAWTLLPWRFWSRVGMHHEVRARRAMIWVPALWLSVWWIVAIERVVLVLVYRGWTGSTIGGALAVWRDEFWWELAWPFLSARDDWFFSNPNAGGFLGWQTWPVYPPIVFKVPMGLWSAVLANAAFALMLLALPDTRAAAKLRPAHIWRGFVFGWSWLGLAMLVLVGSMFDELYQVIATNRTGWISPPWIDLLVADHHWVMLAWIAVWWWCAIKIGYRIERWKTVALAATIPVALAVLVFRVYVFAYFAK
ncbi:MAG: hypothetical protein SFY96_10650 [Planctomycetota bacterium]|nr:hypothetical protein [Planctomycetota bacterium]